MGVEQESLGELNDLLQTQINDWQQLRKRYDGQLLETHVVLDRGERAIERVDHPRVPFIPTLRYGQPIPEKANWTLLAPAQAAQLVSELDRQQPAFGPHRAQDIRELIRDRIAAAERGLRILDERLRTEASDEEESDRPRP